MNVHRRRYPPQSDDPREIFPESLWLSTTAYWVERISDLVRVVWALRRASIRHASPTIDFVKDVKPRA